jgi:hypothetical protein
MCRTSVIGVSDTAIRPILEVSVLHKVKVFELMVFSGRFYFSGDFTSVAEKTMEDPSLSSMFQDTEVYNNRTNVVHIYRINSSKL